MQGTEGQLGLGDALDRFYPIRVATLTSMRVIAVAAGSRHSLAVTCLGHVYGWGSNRCGQLGLPEMGSTIRPTLISSLQGTAAPAAAKCLWQACTRSKQAHSLSSARHAQAKELWQWLPGQAIPCSWARPLVPRDCRPCISQGWRGGIQAKICTPSLAVGSQITRS